MAGAPQPPPEDAWAQAARVALLIYLAVLLGLTFLPLPSLPWPGPTNGVALDLNLRPFQTIDRALELGPGSQQFRVLVGNVVAFVPFGVLAPLARRSGHTWLGILASALALTVAIELGQLLLSALIGVAYRSADVDDVMVNVLGAAVGYAAFRFAGAIGANRSP